MKLTYRNLYFAFDFTTYVYIYIYVWMHMHKIGIIFFMEERKEVVASSIYIKICVKLKKTYTIL